jgi:hypothetical protein
MLVANGDTVVIEPDDAAFGSLGVFFIAAVIALAIYMFAIGLLSLAPVVLAALIYSSSRCAPVARRCSPGSAP